MTTQPPVSHQRSLPQHYTPSTSSTNGATPNEPSPTNFDSSPAVAELTQQISQTRALNLELHNQLSEHSSTANAVDAALSAELSSVREAKRVEDVARGELKARTKTLEDSRRAAEAGKRDAERRLRATQKAKVEAGTCIEKLGEEIRALEAQVQQDEVAIQATAEAAAQEDMDIRARVKHCQGEVRVAEEVVTALNIRVRELEDSIERERIALTAARDKAEALQREQDSHKFDIVPEQPLDTWEQMPTSEFSLASPVLEQRTGHEILDPFPTPLEKDSDRDRERGGSGSVSTLSSPHLCSITTAPSLNVGYGTNSQAELHPIGAPESRARLAKGYSIFDEDLASLPNPVQGPNFLPFGDSDVADGSRTLSLIPNGLTQSSDGISTSANVGEVGTPGEMFTRSTQPDNEAFDGDWRRFSIPAVGSDSHVFPRVDDGPIESSEPFGIRPLPRHRMTSDPIDVPGVWSRANSDPVPPPIVAVGQQEARTRWWRAPDKERRSTFDGSESRRGLNPDAKVFNFSAKPLFGMPTVPAFDALNGSTSDRPVSGVTTGSATTTTTANSNNTPGFFSGLAMRAFAPSPAEREALQRALGLSNTSFERLPSLSEVGSMPTPALNNHGPAHPTASGNLPGMPWVDIGAGPGTGRSWLRELGVSMPRPGKIKFSPWGDGDGDGIEADK